MAKLANVQQILVSEMQNLRGKMTTAEARWLDMLQYRLDHGGSGLTSKEIELIKTRIDKLRSMTGA